MVVDYNSMEDEELETYLEDTMIDMEDATYAFMAAYFLEKTSESLGDRVFDRFVLDYTSEYFEAADKAMDRSFRKYKQALDEAKDRDNIDVSKFDFDIDEIVDSAAEDILALSDDRVGISGLAKSERA